MARKKRSFPKVRKQIDKMKETYEDIKQNESNSKTTDEKDYEYWVINIVDSIENKNSFNREFYNKMIEKYPQTRAILDELIGQVQLFSIYDLEPSTINFNYSAYLLKIKNLIE
jgi:predicted nuclease with TOPRIM domain